MYDAWAVSNMIWIPVVIATSTRRSINPESKVVFFMVDPFVIQLARET